jgi:hypothetical protein
MESGLSFCCKFLGQNPVFLMNHHSAKLPKLSKHGLIFFFRDVNPGSKDIFFLPVVGTIGVYTNEINGCIYK